MARSEVACCSTRSGWRHGGLWPVPSFKDKIRETWSMDRWHRLATALAKLIFAV